MKKHLSKVITLALILGLSAVFVSAGSAGKKMITVFEVDFDFQIGNKTYSKGKYRLSREHQTVIILENLEEPETKLLMGIPTGGDASKSNDSTLVFHRYGDRYFLRQVISPVISARVKMSDDEKDARREARENLAQVVVKGGK